MERSGARDFVVKLKITIFWILDFPDDADDDDDVAPTIFPSGTHLHRAASKRPAEFSCIHLARKPIWALCLPIGPPKGIEVRDFNYFLDFSRFWILDAWKL